MHRRDLLHPSQLARTAAGMLGLDELGIETPPADAALLRFARRAMAATFEIILPFGTNRAHEAAAAALDEIDRLEAQLTVFRDDSEVSRLNRLGSYGTVQLEPGLFGLLELAARLSRETEGAYDLTTGALTKTWGFYRRQGRVPSEAELAAALAKVGMGYVSLDPQRRTAHYLRPGLEINLGSIGKGYALDRVAELLRCEWGQENALLHGGRSSVYALGDEPGGRHGWAVGLSHPWQPERRLAVLHLRNQALGTSAATFQHLEYQGRKLGHILDPRSGWPAEGLASATALAPTAAEADALATAFFILGIEKTQTYCAAHPEIGALLLPAGEDARPVLIQNSKSEIRNPKSEAADSDFGFRISNFS
jgi:thiamine biosynthesis lipoprotein